MDHIPVFELEEIPGDITKRLQQYYDENGHRGINNDSFTRYPHLFDWETTDEFNEIDEWFNKKIDCVSVGYVIIHWEW